MLARACPATTTVPTCTPPLPACATEYCAPAGCRVTPVHCAHAAGEIAATPRPAAAVAHRRTQPTLPAAPVFIIIPLSSCPSNAYPGHRPGSIRPGYALLGQ